MTRRASRNGAPHCDELAWFLLESPSILGERSSHPSLIASIERGATSGCKGTAGVGRAHDDPFPLNEFESMRMVRRATKCLRSWAEVSYAHRIHAVSIYRLEPSKLPVGLHGRLGDLSGLALMLADEIGQTTELIQAIPRWSTSGTKWQRMAEVASRCAHEDWWDCRVRVDREERSHRTGFEGGPF